MLCYGDPSCKPECGIVFTSTRDESENPESYSRNKLARDIRKAFPCNLNEIGIYHAGVSDKQQVQKDFIDGKLKLLSATKAFGIGVNKTDIQFTIHRQLPWSIESFYQEAGRAGRAGQSAHCYILFAPKQLGSKQAIQTVFAPDATPEEIATSGVQGDLRTLFYLWGQNNKGIDAEVGYIQELRNRLNVSYRKRRSDSQDYCTIYADRVPKKGDSAPNGYVILTKDDLELALYHLKLLGVVNDWLVDWRNNSFDVFPGSRDPESVSAHLFQYIRRHDAAFANPWRDVDLKYKRILESQTENYINSHARALIAWTYDHIVYSRREAIKNMLDFCNEYRDPVSFRKRIDNFLRIPEQSVLLDGIIGNPHNWHMWFQLLQREEHLSPLKTVINPLRMHELKNLGDVIRRYRESYQENTGLNLIYALSSAFCSEMDSNTELLLGNALQSIVSEGPLQNSCFFIFNEILARCVTYLPYTDLQSRSSIARQLLRFYPQKARDINRTLHDPVSYSALLITATEKIHHAMGGIL